MQKTTDFSTLNKIKSPHFLIRTVWPKLKNIAGGKYLFSCIFRSIEPSFHSICPTIEKIEEGHARVSIKDGSGIGTKSNLLHHNALANLGEFSARIALASMLDAKGQSTLSKIEAEYVQMAFNYVYADSVCHTFDHSNQETDICIRTDIKNSKSELVCVVYTTWKIRA